MSRLPSASASQCESLLRETGFRLELFEVREEVDPRDGPDRDPLGHRGGSRATNDSRLGEGLEGRPVP
jgi:hypothetical protein